MDLVEARACLEEWFSIEILTSNVTIGSLAQLTVAVCVALLAAVLLRRFAMRARLRRRLSRGVACAISRGAQYTVISAGVLVAIQFVGIDFSSLGLVFGLLSVGVGFGLRNVTAKRDLHLRSSNLATAPIEVA